MPDTSYDFIKAVVHEIQKVHNAAIQGKRWARKASNKPAQHKRNQAAKAGDARWKDVTRVRGKYWLQYTGVD